MSADIFTIPSLPECSSLVSESAEQTPPSNGYLPLPGNLQNKPITDIRHRQCSSAPPLSTSCPSSSYPNNLFDIKKLLRSPINQDGFVYIFKAYWNSKLIVKIGITKDVENRLQQLSRGCCSTTLRDMTEFTSIDVILRDRVEALVHKELQAFKMDATWCKCKHHEYFDIPPEVALKSIERWKLFVENGAYTSEGTIDNIWAQQINELQRPSQEELDAFKNDMDKHHQLRDERYQRWIKQSILVVKRGGRKPRQ